MARTSPQDGVMPWSSLGKDLPPDATVAQAISMAGLSWLVQKFPLTYKHGTAEIESGAHALVRSDTGLQLSIITENWEPTQNVQTLERFFRFKEVGVTPIVAGSMIDGRIVWMLGRIGDKSPDETHLLFTHPHVYGQSTNVRPIIVNRSWQDTLVLPWDRLDNSSLDLSVEFDLDQAKEIVKRANVKFTQYADRMKALSKDAPTEDQMKAYFSSVLPAAYTKNKNAISRGATLCMEVAKKQRDDGVPISSWASACHIVLYVVDNLLGNTDDTRLHSAWYGINQRRKTDALKYGI